MNLSERITLLRGEKEEIRNILKDFSKFEVMPHFVENWQYLFINLFIFEENFSY